MEIIIHIDKLELEFQPFKPKLIVFVTGSETATRFSNVFKWRNLFINNSTTHLLYHYRRVITKALYQLLDY